MKKNPLITGTLLLTAAGFLSRILGFFYRIFLSRTIGAEGPVSYTHLQFQISPTGTPEEDLKKMLGK